MSTLSQMTNTPQLIDKHGRIYTNNSAIPTELALLAIHYATQYDGKPTTATNLSVTDFLQPMRKLIYKIQNPANTDPIDVATIMKSSIGTILHEGLETALEATGNYTQEIRSEKQIAGVTVSGKFDLIDNSTNVLKDLKNISSFAYKKLQEDLVKLDSIDPTETYLWDKELNTFTKVN